MKTALRDDLDDEKKIALPEMPKTRRKNEMANVMNDARFQVFYSVCNTKLPKDGFIPHPLDEEVFKMGCTIFIGRKECRIFMSMKVIGANHLLFWMA